MKQLTKDLTLKTFMTFLMIAFLQTIVSAQEEGQGSGTPSIGTSSSNTTTTKSVVTESSDWYSSPWVWVIGAAIFILLLVSLLRGRSSRSESVTVTKSTRAE